MNKDRYSLVEKMLDQSGNWDLISVVAAAPFSALQLHYTIESLDEGWSKEQGHSQEVDEADLTNLCIDKVQAGLGCEDSWGRYSPSGIPGAIR